MNFVLRKKWSLKTYYPIILHNKHKVNVKNPKIFLCKNQAVSRLQNKENNLIMFSSTWSLTLGSYLTEGKEDEKKCYVNENCVELLPKIYVGESTKFPLEKSLLWAPKCIHIKWFWLYLTMVGVQINVKLSFFCIYVRKCKLKRVSINVLSLLIVLQMTNLISRWCLSSLENQWLEMLSMNLHIFLVSRQRSENCISQWQEREPSKKKDDPLDCLVEIPINGIQHQMECIEINRWFNIESQHISCANSYRDFTTQSLSIHHLIYKELRIEHFMFFLFLKMYVDQSI